MARSIRERFAGMTRLYHFTSYDTACKIIESKRLKFGPLSQMNDLVENGKIVFQRTFLGDLQDDRLNGRYAEEEMLRYQQICFSQDRVEGEDVYEGFNLHPMWGLYADKGLGVCLVFDKDKLKLDEGDYARDVKYVDILFPSYAFKNKSKTGLKSEIWSRREDIFFRKRKEWVYEQEYRIIRRAKSQSDENFLDVSESLSFVILCRDNSVTRDESIWTGMYYEAFRSIDRKLPILSYELGLDGFELWRDVPDDPIWTELGGFWL